MVNTITTSTATMGKEMSPSELTVAIKAEYDRRQARKTSDTPNRDNQALIASLHRRNSPNYNNKISNLPPNRSTTCTNCNRNGHTISECWAKGGGKEGQGPKFRTGRGRGRSGPRSSTRNEKTANIAEDPFAFMTSTTELTKADPITDHIIVWDSGTNNHMSPHRNLFTNF